MNKEGDCVEKWIFFLFFPNKATDLLMDVLTHVYRKADFLVHFVLCVYFFIFCTFFVPFHCICKAKILWYIVLPDNAEKVKLLLAI